MCAEEQTICYDDMQALKQVESKIETCADI